MTTRLVRGIALTLGAGALATAALVQQAVVSPTSTVQAGARATAAAPQPITFGLIPPQHSVSKPSANDADKPYDYVNSCSLIPLGDIHRITGDRRLLYTSKSHDGLTAKVGDARTASAGEAVGQQDNCFLTTDLGYVKVQLMVGITPSEQLAVFNIHYKQVNHDDNRTIWAERVSTRGLPGADSAYMTYSVERGERLYQELLVHTKGGQTLDIIRGDRHQLRQLAAAALSTLNGTRYPGK